VTFVIWSCDSQADKFGKSPEPGDCSAAVAASVKDVAYVVKNG